MNPIWQIVIIPLATIVLTAAFNWLTNHHAVRRQRNDRLCALLQSGSIDDVHPLVLKMAVDEAYGVRVTVDPRAIRFALKRQFDGEQVLRAFLSARDLVRFNSPQKPFEDARRWSHLLSGYQQWKWMAFVTGIALYFVFLVMTGLSHAAADMGGMMISLMLAMICIPVGILLSIAFGNAQYLIDLQPEENILDSSETVNDFVDIPAFSRTP